jgi:nitric oxide dioxygenase
VTPEQVSLVQESWAALGPQLNDFATRFYRLFFEADSSARTLFSEDPNVQADILITEMALIVTALPRFEAFTIRARELGARHANYGVTYHHFEVAERVLMQTFEEVLGSAFTDELRDAWRMGFDLMAETMMQGAADAVP